MKCVPAVTGSFAWLASCGLLAPRRRSHGGHELADAAEGWVRIVAGQGTLHAQDGEVVGILSSFDLVAYLALQGQGEAGTSAGD